MKAFRFFVLPVFLSAIVLSCTKGVPDAEYVLGATYLYDDGTLTVQLSSRGVTFFVDGEYVYQNYDGVSLEGEYPSMTCRVYTADRDFPEFSFGMTFSGRDSFVAVPSDRTVSFRNYNPYLGTFTGNVTLSFPAGMEFRDATGVVLDANGDGILDSRQPEFFGKWPAVSESLTCSCFSHVGDFL